jgi:hypothetical protein
MVGSPEFGALYSEVLESIREESLEIEQLGSTL